MDLDEALAPVLYETTSFLNCFSDMPDHRRNRGRFPGSYVAARRTRSGSRGTEGAPWTLKRSPRNR
jgi:hypothetical protein